MKMMKGWILAGVAAIATGPVLAQDWQPSEPITIVVPWAAGGSTDAVTRIAAGDLEQALGQSVIIVNQPGASGSVGTRSAWEAEHDGLTMAAGAVADLGAYPVFGTLDVPVDQWRVYLLVANPALISVNPDTEWEDFGQLLDDLQNRDEPVIVASAGISSAGAIAMQGLEGVVDINYREIVYEGGNPAVISTVGGETEMTAQTAVEQVDMIRANRLRPLTVVASQPLTLDGYGEIPPITEWIDDLPVANNYFGIFLPADAPQEVIATMDRIWEEEIANSEALQRYAAERGSLFDPLYGEEALEAAMPALSINAWQQFESGQAPNEPSEFGIPRP